MNLFSLGSLLCTEEAVWKTIGLTSTIINCFERLDTAHVSSALPSTYDSHKSSGPPHSPVPILTGKAPPCACFSSTSVLLSTASFPPYLNQEAPRQVHQFFSAVLTIPQAPPRAHRDMLTRHANWKSAHRSNVDVKFANGAASVVIINNERAHWESKTLTSWFRTTQSPSSDN